MRIDFDGVGSTLSEGRQYKFEATAIGQSGRDIGKVTPMWSIVYTVKWKDDLLPERTFARIDGNGLFWGLGDGDLTVRAVLSVPGGFIVEDKPLSLQGTRLYPEDRRVGYESFYLPPQYSGARINYDDGGFLGFTYGWPYEIKLHPVSGNTALQDKTLDAVWAVIECPTCDGGGRSKVAAVDSRGIYKGITFGLVWVQAKLLNVDQRIEIHSTNK